MSGVTHFERRDRAGRKKVHPTCPFCAKTFRTTPKTIFKAGGPSAYVDSFLYHMMDHLHEAESIRDYGKVKQALEAMGSFTVGVYNNC